MCYVLHGALYGNINTDDYEWIESKYEFKFRLGAKHDVKMSVKGSTHEFGVTGYGCDCDIALGKGDINEEELKAYTEFFEDVMLLDGAEHIYLCKTWTGTSNKREIKLKLNEINIRETLANLEENSLYTFEIC